MSCKKTLCIISMILFLGLSGLWAGDTAIFVDLGFSPDGTTYMFAQYGVQSRTLRPWADLFIVDVPRNNFVSGGRVSFAGDRQVVSGRDGSGALYHIIARNAALAERHRIDYTSQGRPIFIALDGSAPVAAGRQAPIEFRDFETGTSYTATLISQVEGSGANLRSAFHINLERTARNGSRQNYTVGTPQHWRPLIASYRIRQVMVDPNENSMILVIEMRRLDGADVSIRFMVEALRF